MVNYRLCYTRCIPPVWPLTNSHIQPRQAFRFIGNLAEKLWKWDSVNHFQVRTVVRCTTTNCSCEKRALTQRQVPVADGQGCRATQEAVDKLTRRTVQRLRTVKSVLLCWQNWSSSHDRWLKSLKMVLIGWIPVLQKLCVWVHNPLRHP